jgi:hypothetical protein
MKKLPSNDELNIWWSVATSSSIETGTRPHHGFAQMLYDYITDKHPPVGLYDDSERKKSTSQET